MIFFFLHRKLALEEVRFMDLTIFIFNIIGTVAFAVSGATVAVKKRFDIFGIIVLGVTTAVGGGFIRDIVLGNVPPVALTNPIYTVIAIVSAVLAALPTIRKRVGQNNKVFDRLMFFMDTIGLAAFTTTGVLTCFESGAHSLFVCLFVGVVTGVGGGVLRDLFSNEPPYIFRKHIYACAAAAGAVVTHVLCSFTYPTISMIVGFFVIAVIRFLSAYYRWNLPVVEEE